MKLRYTLGAVFICSVLLLCWLVHERYEPISSAVTKTGIETAPVAFSPIDTPTPNESPSHFESEREGSPYELRAINFSGEAFATEAKDLARGFRIEGNQNNIRIVDSKGKAVVELGSNPHFNSLSSECTANSNGKRILVNYGADAAYDIVELGTGLKRSLPIQPPGDNKLGFGSWRWIDDDTLLGESGDEVVPRKKGIEGEGNNVAQTRLYLYNVSRQALEEVQLPKQLGAKVFSVTEVSPDGYIHLIHDDPSATQPPDLGWFKVRGK